MKEILQGLLNGIIRMNILHSILSILHLRILNYLCTEYGGASQTQQIISSDSAIGLLVGIITYCMPCFAKFYIQCMILCMGGQVFRI